MEDFSCLNNTAAPDTLAAELHVRPCQRNRSVEIPFLDYICSPVVVPSHDRRNRTGTHNTSSPIYGRCT